MTSKASFHLNAWRKSGESKKRYCEEAGINYGTFIWWGVQEKKMEAEHSGRFIKIEKLPVESGVEILFPNGVCVKTQQILTIDLLKMLKDV